MTTVFDGLDVVAFGAVAGVFGEAATIRPRTTVGGVNGSPAADPDRAVVALAAPLAVFDQDLHGVAPRSAWDARAIERLREVGATLTVEVLLAAVGYEPVAGDLVERPARGLVYAVVAPAARKGASVVLGLAVAGTLSA